MRPNIGAIVRDENGHVAEELDVMFGDMWPSVLPLAGELVLEEGVKLDARRELLPPTRHGGRLAAHDGAFPLSPRHAAMGLFQRHEQRIIVEPLRLTFG